MINWRGILFNNLPLKLVSILLATLLWWFQVANREMVEREVTLPLDVINLSDRLAIASDYPRSVKVRVRTVRDVLPEEFDLSVVIDLKDAQRGRFVEPSPPTVPNKPQDMKFLSFVTPPLIELTIEEKITGWVPIEADLYGEPTEGFELTALTTRPANASVEGPSSAIEALEAVPTVPVSIEGEGSGTIVRQAGLFTKDDRIAILSPEDSMVTVTIQIEEKRREIQLQVPVVIEPQDSGARLRTSQVTVRGTVPVSFTEDPDPESFVAAVNTQNLQPRGQDYELVPRVVVPEPLQDVFRVEEIGTVKIRKRR